MVVVVGLMSFINVFGKSCWDGVKYPTWARALLERWEVHVVDGRQVYEIV